MQKMPKMQEAVKYSIFIDICGVVQRYTQHKYTHPVLTCIIDGYWWINGLEAGENLGGLFCPPDIAKHSAEGVERSRSVSLYTTNPRVRNHDHAFWISFLQIASFIEHISAHIVLPIFTSLYTIINYYYYCCTYCNARLFVFVKLLKLVLIVDFYQFSVCSAICSLRPWPWLYPFYFSRFLLDLLHINSLHTVDGRNPAPPRIYEIL